MHAHVNRISDFHLAQLKFMNSAIRGTKHRLTEKKGNIYQEKNSA